MLVLVLHTQCIGSGTGWITACQANQPAQHQGVLRVVLGLGHVGLPAALQQVTRLVTPRLPYGRRQKAAQRCVGRAADVLKVQQYTAYVSTQK
jgi:hypothetical protein